MMINVPGLTNLGGGSGGGDAQPAAPTPAADSTLPAGSAPKPAYADLFAAAAPASEVVAPNGKGHEQKVQQLTGVVHGLPARSCAKLARTLKTTSSGWLLRTG
jgi:hypothetical protein